MVSNTKGAPLRRFLKNRVGRVVTHSGFIAAVLGIIAFYWIGFSPNPYLFTAERIKTLSETAPGISNYYADLNSDGNQYRYYLANGEGSNSMLVVYESENSVKDQWNFMGSMSCSTVGYYIGNYNHDRCLEIACFSVKGKFIYLNVVEPFGSIPHVMKNRLVDTIWSSDLDPTLRICHAQFCDLNSDGFDELLFGLEPGQARQPRKLYAYDIKADSLWSSPLSGTVYDHPLVFDFDHDGRKEIFCETYASNNYPEGNNSYPDTCSWYVVLNDRLDYKIPPQRMGGCFSCTFSFLVERDGNYKLFAVVYDTKNLATPCNWFVINTDLSLLPTTSFLNNSNPFISGIWKSASGQDQLLSEMSSKRRFIVSNFDVFDFILPRYNKCDVPIFNYKAGLPELEYAVILEGMQETMLFFDKVGNKLGTIDLDSTDQGYRICWTGFKDGLHQFRLTGLKWERTITVQKNPWQYLQYLILIGLIAGFFGFITFIRFIQSQQIARQEAIRRDVLELQLKAVRNQLDPHFTFNALNTLSGLSLTGDKKGVDHFINHFSRLLRTHLQTSDKIMVPLKEEIEFVVNYVELQRIRFDNVFYLELDVPKEVDLGTLIPKMLIQTHVENAIKHGFRGLRVSGTDATAGRLLVQVRETDKALIIIIEDNGVGRGNSKVPEFESTGKGLLSIDRIREAVKQLYGIRISQVVEDLFGEGGRAVGTRVVVRVEG